LAHIGLHHTPSDAIAIARLNTACDQNHTLSDAIATSIKLPPPDPESPPAFARLAFPERSTLRATRPTTPPRRPLVECCIPMDKARPALVFSVDNYPYFAQGSLNDPAILIQSASPTTPFEFPFDSHHNTALPLLANEFDRPRIPSEGVQLVVGLPRVVGLHDSTGPYAWVNRLTYSATTHDATSHPSMMDGGANICVTGVLGLLVDVSSIPPLPITVATKTDHISVNDCCTKRGYLPLMLTNGSVYYQICYYCANPSERLSSCQMPYYSQVTSWLTGIKKATATVVPGQFSLPAIAGSTRYL
jgi:hypothetical protein